MRQIEIPFAGCCRIYDARDENTANRITEFIHQRDDAFTRNPEIGHVTGSAVIVDPSFGLVLLTHHRKLDRWLQLGGHCDGIKDPYFVAKKEAYEESGLRHILSPITEILDLDIHPIPAIRDTPEHLHFDVRYLYVADPDEPLSVSSESKDLRWVPLADLENFAEEESILRLPEKIRKLGLNVGG